MTEESERLSVWTRPTPGDDMTVVGIAATIAEARTIAARYSHRSDLRMQDVEIRLGRNGKLVERAGPLG